MGCEGNMHFQKHALQRMNRKVGRQAERTGAPIVESRREQHWHDVIEA